MNVTISKEAIEKLSSKRATGTAWAVYVEMLRVAKDGVAEISQRKLGNKVGNPTRNTVQRAVNQLIDLRLVKKTARATFHLRPKNGAFVCTKNDACTKNGAKERTKNDALTPECTKNVALKGPESPKNGASHKSSYVEDLNNTDPIGVDHRSSNTLSKRKKPLDHNIDLKLQAPCQKDGMTAGDVLHLWNAMCDRRGWGSKKVLVPPDAVARRLVKAFRSLPGRDEWVGVLKRLEGIPEPILARMAMDSLGGVLRTSKSDPSGDSKIVRLATGEYDSFLSEQELDESGGGGLDDYLRLIKK